MKRLKQYYFVPVIIATLTAVVLSWICLTPDLFWSGVLVALLPLIVLGIGFRIITHQRIKIIRKQLYQIIQTLEEFDIDEPRKVAFENSPFPIFNELNVYLIELINRIRSNYRANKQFTQNASHELQTPLAIIKGHIEILLQSPNIGEKEFESLALVLQNTNRLSRLNSALILLSKIEYQRFSDSEKVNFSKIAEESLRNFKDIIHLQEIEIQNDITGNFEMEMSRSLAEILIANLIQNAIRYNLENGYIKFEIKPQSFSVSNPGKKLKTNPKDLFKRFRRESNVEESLGLGLSIVKRICEQYNLQLTYSHDNGLHTLKVEKPT